MGAHGIGLFQDDDGADFAAEILDSESMDVIVDALKAVPEIESEYLEHPEGVRALVAAEIVADQNGADSIELSDDLHCWASNLASLTKSLFSWRGLRLSASFATRKHGTSGVTRSIMRIGF